jgi:hypothetical protein
MADSTRITKITGHRLNFTLEKIWFRLNHASGATGEMPRPTTRCKRKDNVMKQISMETCMRITYMIFKCWSKNVLKR